MKKIVLCFSVLLLLVVVAYAETLPLEVLPITTKVSSGTNVPTQLQSNIGGLSIGFIKVGTQDVTTLSWHPDLKFGPWGFGADLNLGLGSNIPTGYENLVVRYVEYDDSQKGLRYGILDGVTVGHGLVMRNYSTRNINQVLLANEQMGLKGYVDLDRYAVRGMMTKSNIYMGRVEERINPVLTLGQYYINDSTGRTVTQVGGGTRQFPAVAAVGADASIALPANMEVYSEVGSLINHGSGLSAGFSWAYDIMVANTFFLAEYRLMDKGFVPGYFGVDYETNPIDLASAEATGQAKNGVFTQLGINALGLASLSAIYESYQGSNSALTADLNAKASDQVNFHGYYKQPNFVDFRSLDLSQGAILAADVTYKMNQNTSLIYHYKKAFDPTLGQVVSTQYYEIGLSF